MQTDPNNKNNPDRSNDYDKDNKITNNDYPVTEGQEDSSIQSNKAPEIDLTEGDKQKINGSKEENAEFIGMYNDETKKENKK